jgi:hyaluronoglucosaminidase
MTNYIRLFALASVVFFSCGSLVAQETDFDLASQRSELQNIPKVPGEVVVHKGLVINPTPHDISVSTLSQLDISRGIKLKDKKGKFGGDMKFMTMVDRGGIQLSVDFGTKLAFKNHIKAVSGAYSLVVDKKGIKIVGYDERGAYYGIQTLRQIVAQSVSDKGIPYLSVNDYPDLSGRGVVEGFYGTPWSHQVRLSLIDFYGKSKLDTYIYGPKDDPYHSCPNWRLPYPEKEANNIKELVAACNRNRVDFVWAIHPGQDIKWNEEDYKNLVNKFDMMYNLGVRSFAIFFDDISGEGTNPEKQVDLLNRLAVEFVKAKGDVTPLIMCPTDYSKLWANPTPQGSLSIYGQKLDPSIKVFWTGDVVCSDMTKSTMDWVNSRIKRPAFYWWNFPVTDYVRHIVLQGPVYGLDTSLTSQDVCAFVSNPMENGEASKLSLYGVADYTWNIAAYNPMDNWNRAFADITPEVKDAYRTFAIHSCDTETGYRRDESWETETFAINKYTEGQFTSLYGEFEKIEKVPAIMENGCRNKALINELRPWLDEFGKLGTRGRKALDLIKLYRAGSDADFWAAYTQNIMTDKERKDYNAHKSGTMKLQPFYENTMDDLLSAFYTKVSGKVSTGLKAIGSFANVGTPTSKLMFDNDSISYYTSGISQKAGDWIGVSLGALRNVSSVTILQGRNSKDDVDYFDHAVLEYSADGRSWMPLTGELQKQYVINWKGTPVQAKYIRLKRLDSSKKNYASVRSFVVNPLSVENLGFAVESDQIEKALYAFDGNPTTLCHSNGCLTFGIARSAKKDYTMLLRLSQSSQPVVLRQLNIKGKVLSQTTVDTPFFQFSLVKGATKVEIDGEVDIFEIMQ